MSTDPSSQPWHPSRQEPPTRPVPQWQAPPPPPPPASPQEQRQPQEQWPQQEQWQAAQPPTSREQWPPPPPAGESPRARRRRGRRRVHRSVMVLFTLIVLLLLLVIGDRVALAVTENQFATQFQANGFPVKPSVSIEGWPFLTQLAGKDFHKVDISASNVPAGPVTISSVHATLDNLRISGYSSSAAATVSQLNATAFISFSALAAAGGLGNGNGITVKPDGADKVKITASLGGIFSNSEEAQITQTGPRKISVKVLNNGTAIGSLLSSFGSFSFSLPSGVPASLKITGLALNSQGLTVSAAATNATFTKQAANGG